MNDHTNAQAGPFPVVVAVDEQGAVVVTGGASNSGECCAGHYPSLFALCQAAPSFVEGQVYQTVSFYSGYRLGGHAYIWLSTVDKSLANGGTLVDPSNLGGLTEAADQGVMNAYLSAQGSGTGTGCLLSIHSNSEVSIEQFGGLPDIQNYDVKECFKKIMATITAPKITLAEGTYYVVAGKKGDTPIMLSDYAVLQGAGMFKTTIKVSDNTASPARIPVGTYGATGVVLRDLGIDGNRARYSPGSHDRLSDCFDVDQNAIDLTIQNVYVRNALGEGIDIDSATGLTVDNLLVRNCAGNGLHISDRRPPKNANVSNIRVENCAHERGVAGDPRAAGVLLRASKLNLNNVIVESCYRGIWLNGEGISSSNRSPVNVTNLQVSGSAFEDLGQNASAPGLNVNNFIFSRDTGNSNKDSVTIKSSDVFALANGFILGGGNITVGNIGETSSSSVTVSKGMTISNVSARDSHLSLATSSSFKISNNEFNNINLYGSVRRGTITGNIANGHITSDTNLGALQSRLVVTGNQTTSVAANLKNNSRVVVGMNIEE